MTHLAGWIDGAMPILLAGVMTWFFSAVWRWYGTEVREAVRTRSSEPLRIAVTVVAPPAVLWTVTATAHDVLLAGGDWTWYRSSAIVLMLVALALLTTRIAIREGRYF